MFVINKLEIIKVSNVILRLKIIIKMQMMKKHKI